MVLADEVSVVLMLQQFSSRLNVDLTFAEYDAQFIGGTDMCILG